MLQKIFYQTSYFNNKGLEKHIHECCTVLSMMQSFVLNLQLDFNLARLCNTQIKVSQSLICSSRSWRHMCASLATQALKIKQKSFNDFALFWGWASQYLPVSACPPSRTCKDSFGHKRINQGPWAKSGPIWVIHNQ